MRSGSTGRAPLGTGRVDLCRFPFTENAADGLERLALFGSNLCRVLVEKRAHFFVQHLLRSGGFSHPSIDGQDLIRLGRRRFKACRLKLAIRRSGSGLFRQNGSHSGLRHIGIGCHRVLQRRRGIDSAAGHHCFHDRARSASS